MKMPSIKTSIVLIFATISVMSITSGAVAIYGLNSIKSGTEQIGKVSMPKVEQALGIRNALGNLRLAFNRQLVASTLEEMDAETKSQAVVEADLDAALAAYKALATQLDIAQLDTLVSAINDYRAAGKAMLGKRDIGRMMEAKILLRGDMATFEAKAEEAVSALVSTVASSADTTVADAQVAYDTTFWVTLAVVLGAVAASVLSSIYALLKIAKPLEVMTGSVVRLAAGDVKTLIPFATRTDEIGAIAGAVEVFRQAVIEKEDLQVKANADRSLSEQERAANEQAMAARNNAMQHATNALASGLRRLSAGDLSVQIDEGFASEFEALRQDFNHAVEQLRDTLATVAEASNNIDNGSREIAHGSNDLAKRTEQQAAALEETAAALDQITANVSASAKKTEEAKKVAGQADVSAKKSGDVVSEAVHAMSRIEDSSRRISAIIGVIDEIAFQTNLLALNAGVEAARAGDAGKGFAVVAQEVRELAQRSASAAKEISGLIQTSTTEVANGVKMVSETGTALKTIEGFVVAINQHMESIAVAAREQSQGLAAVNSAVNQMDQTTQQNAAMVEETTAASNALAGEASALREMISHFNLDQNHHSAAQLKQMARSMAA